MHRLSRASIQKLNAGQVVPTIPNAVKELVENSLDAGAKNIEILLERGGLDLIRVKDDGVGISKAGHATCALPHYTSKLKDFSELESLRSYGFRGEALSALANVGRLSIFTRTKDDEVGYQLSFNPDGSLQTTEEFPRLDSPGTIIEVRQLFHTLVVRRQRAESQASKGKELETVNKYIIELAVIHPEVKFNLKAPPGKELKLSILSQQTPLARLEDIYGPTPRCLLQKTEKVFFIDREEIKIEVLLPAGRLADKNDEAHGTSDLKHVIRSNNDRCFFFVNNRPINPLQIITRPINVAFRRHFNLPTGRFPFLFVSLTVPTDQCDVNLTPEKRSVKLRGEDFYYETTLDLLNDVYPLPVLAPPLPQQTSSRNGGVEGTNQGGRGEEDDDDAATQLYPNQEGQRSSPSPSDSNGDRSEGNRYIYRASPAALEQAAKWLPTAQNSKGRDITVPSPFAGLVTPGRPPPSTSTFSSTSAFPNRSTNVQRRDNDFADDDLLDLGENSSPSPKSPTSILPLRYGSSPSSSSPSRSSHSLSGSSTSSSSYWSSASPSSTSRPSYSSSSSTSYSTPLTPSSSERKRSREPEFEDNYAVDFDDESTDFVRASQQNNQPRNPNMLNLPSSSPSSGLQALKKFSPQKPIPQYLSRSEDERQANVLAERRGTTMSFSGQAPPSSQPQLTPRPALFQRPASSSASASSPSGPSEVQVGDIHAEMTDYLRSISRESVIKRGNIYTTGNKSKTTSSSTSSQNNFSLTDTQVEVLGRCSSGLLLVKARSCLWLFNPQRAEEAAKFYDMIANQTLQSRPLNVPNQLDSSLFSPDLWRILETASENTKSKEAQILSKNGFSLRSSKRSKVATSPSSSSSVIEVVATAESVLLKADDLLELCRLINASSSSSSSSSSLVCPRPSVVLKHFSSEARRLSQMVLNSNISLEGAKDVLTRLQKLSPKGSTSECPHGQKMFQLMYQI